MFNKYHASVPHVCTNICCNRSLIGWVFYSNTWRQKPCPFCMIFLAMSRPFSRSGLIIGWEVSTSSARSPTCTQHIKHLLQTLLIYALTIMGNLAPCITHQTRHLSELCGTKQFLLLWSPLTTGGISAEATILFLLRFFIFYFFINTLSPPP